MRTRTTLIEDDMMTWAKYETLRQNGRELTRAQDLFREWVDKTMPDYPELELLVDCYLEDAVDNFNAGVYDD